VIRISSEPMEPYSLLISNIIKEQEVIIGPVALEQAQKIDGLEISSLSSIKILGKPKEVIAKLVDQYVKLFGRASIEVCKEAVRATVPEIPKELLPDILL